MKKIENYAEELSKEYWDKFVVINNDINSNLFADMGIDKIIKSSFKVGFLSCYNLATDNLEEDNGRDSQGR